MRPISEEHKAVWQRAISKTRAYLNDEEWTPALADGAAPLTAAEGKRLKIKLRGRPPADDPKRAVSIRLDGDVIAHFKKGGAGWQSRINAALRKQAKLKGK